jgi:hypothetical protein
MINLMFASLRKSHAPAMPAPVEDLGQATNTTKMKIMV